MFRRYAAGAIVSHDHRGLRCASPPAIRRSSLRDCRRHPCPQHQAGSANCETHRRPERRRRPNAVAERRPVNSRGRSAAEPPVANVGIFAQPRSGDMCRARARVSPLRGWRDHVARSPGVRCASPPAIRRSSLRDCRRHPCPQHQAGSANCETHRRPERRRRPNAVAERRPVNSRGRSAAEPPVSDVGIFSQPRSGDMCSCFAATRLARSCRTITGGCAALHPRLFEGRRSATAEGIPVRNTRPDRRTAKHTGAPSDDAARTQSRSDDP